MLIELATQAQVLAEHHYLADPVTSDPKEIPGLSGGVNTLWGYVRYGVPIICAFLLAGAAVMAGANHQAGRPNDGVAKAAVILSVALGVGVIGNVVGAITGT